MTTAELKSFTSKEFDAKKWINQLPEGQVPASIAELELLQSQSYKALDETTLGLLNSIPSLNLNGLKKEIQDLRSVEPGIDLDALVEMDLIKSRMEDCLLKLKEAERWESLESEVSQLFPTGDYGKISIRLQEAQNSLALLGADEYREKKEVLDKLKNQLEAAVSPRIVELSRFDDVKALVDVFRRIDRLDSFYSTYFQSRKKIVAEMFHPEKGDWSRQLGRFYEELFVLVNREFNWLGQLDETKRVFVLLEEVLTPLKLNEFISQKDGELQMLVQAYRETEKFVFWLEQMISNASFVKLNVKWSQSILQAFSEHQRNFNELALKYLRSSDKMLYVKQSLYEQFNTSELKRMRGNVEFVWRCGLDMSHAFCNLQLVDVYRDYFSGTVAELSSQLKNGYQQIKESNANEDELFLSGLGFSKFCFMLERLFEDVRKDMLNDAKLASVVNLVKRAKTVYADGIPEKQDEEEEEYLLKNGTITTLYHLMKLPEAQPKQMSQVDFQLLHMQCVFMLFQTLLKSINQQLTGIAQLECWLSTKSTRPQAAFEQINDLPEFSFTPNQYIKRVGELLLNIPHLLDIALQQEQSEIVVVKGSVYLPHIYKLNEVPAGAVAASLSTQDEDAYTYASEWIFYACLNVIGNLNSQLVTLKLSAVGCKQLLVDLNYLLNILNALGVVEEQEEHKELKMLMVIRNLLEVIGTEEFKNELKRVWNGTHETEGGRKLLELLQNDDSSKRVFVQLLSNIKGFKFDF